LPAKLPQLWSVSSGLPLSVKRFTNTGGKTLKKAAADFSGVKDRGRIGQAIPIEKSNRS
jgi:hypothetical protein